MDFCFGVVNTSGSLEPHFGQNLLPTPISLWQLLQSIVGVSAFGLLLSSFLLLHSSSTIRTKGILITERSAAFSAGSISVSGSRQLMPAVATEDTIGRNAFLAFRTFWSGDCSNFNPGFPSRNAKCLPALSAKQTPWFELGSTVGALRNRRRQGSWLRRYNGRLNPRRSGRV